TGPSSSTTSESDRDALECRRQLAARTPAHRQGKQLNCSWSLSLGPMPSVPRILSLSGFCPTATSISYRGEQDSPGPAGTPSAVSAVGIDWRAASSNGKWLVAFGLTTEVAMMLEALHGSRESAPPRQLHRRKRQRPGAGSKSHVGSPSWQLNVVLGNPL